jgi:hypothetical protein
MLEIKQKKGFETRSYKIDDENEYVEVDYKTIKDKFRYKIHLTEIGNEIQYEADNLFVGKIFLAISVLITLICLGVYFFGNPENPKTYILNIVLWGLISTVAFFKPYKDDIIIVNGNTFLRLFRTKPSEKEVVIFIDNLIKIANQKKKEYAINFNLDEIRFNENMFWLLNQKLIDKTELEELKSEYKIKKLL